MRLFLLILSLALLIGCIKANTLSEVLIGEWTLDHYEAYKDGNPTTAAGSLDKSIKFSSNGRCQWNGKASFDYTLSGNTVKNGYIYKAPRFYVETTISINKEQKNYIVDAVYECWALVIDYTKCSKYEHLGYNYTMEDFTYFHTSGDLGIAFIYGSWTNQPYTIKACPKEDSGYEAKSYNLVTDKNYTGIYVEYGRWYAFSTSSVDDTEGSINVNYPNWNEGSTNP